MNTVSIESPAEEYERKLAERRGDVLDRLAWLWVRCVVGQLLLLLGPTLEPGNFRGLHWGAVSLTSLGVAIAVASAAVAAGITFKNWSALPRTTIALGLMPWMTLAMWATVFLFNV